METAEIGSELYHYLKTILLPEDCYIECKLINGDLKFFYIKKLTLLQQIYKELGLEY